MRRWFLRLYPRAWRERYGEELEALMADAPGGWRSDLDLLRGALTMRLRVLPAWQMLAAMMALGAVGGLAASYLFPEKWEARAVLQVTPARIRIDEDPSQRSRDFLKRCLDRLPEGEFVRVSFDTRKKHGAQVFAIGFPSPDARTALDKTNALVAKLVGIKPTDYYIDLLDQPTLPKHQLFPKREGFAFTGGAAGLTLSLVILLIRRRITPADAGLQPV